MKLCLNTHALGAKMSLDELTSLCQRAGIPGIECSVGYGHVHGIEFSATEETLYAAREKIAAAGLEMPSLATYCRFDGASEKELEDNLRLALHGIDMAHKLGCPAFRFVGNDLPTFLTREAFVHRVAESMRRLAEHARLLGVQVLLNMHGSFNYRHDVAQAVQLSGAENAGLVYNCADEDVIGGSLEAVLDVVGPHIKHVHMHELTGSYPYRQLFAQLQKRGYNGWFSIVLDDPSPETERLLGYYVQLAKALYELGG